MEIYLLNLFSLIIWKFIYEKCNNKEKAKKIIIICIVLQFSIIQGCRSIDVGSDTRHYIDIYENIKLSNRSLYDLYFRDYNIEIGFLTLIKICSFFNLSSQLFLVVVALLINGLLGYFIYKNSDDFILSFWIFVCIEYFTLSFSMLRQMIALLFIANSFNSITSKKIIPFCMWNLGGFLFHKTAIVFIIVYPIYILLDSVNKKMKLSKSKRLFIQLIVLVSILLIILLCGKPLIYLMYKVVYGNYTVSNNIHNLGGLWFVMFAILLLINLIQYKTNHTIDKKMLCFQILSFISVIVQFNTIFIPMIGRIALYFYIFTIITLPYISNFLNKKYKNMFKLSVYCLTFIQYIFISMNMYNVVPYIFFK